MHATNPHILPCAKTIGFYTFTPLNRATVYWPAGSIGELVPLHCTGNGKSIMAQFSSKELAAYAKRTGLPRFTPYTITTLEGLNEEIKRTRARGYAIDQQEHGLNTYCLGAPIFDACAYTIGGCSISGGDPEILTSRLSLLVEHLKYSAQEISRRMGYVPAIP